MHMYTYIYIYIYVYNYVYIDIIHDNTLHVPTILGLPTM